MMALEPEQEQVLLKIVSSTNSSPSLNPSENAFKGISTLISPAGIVAVPFKVGKSSVLVAVPVRL